VGRTLPDIVPNSDAVNAPRQITEDGAEDRLGIRPGADASAHGYMGAVPFGTVGRDLDFGSFECRSGMNHGGTDVLADV
jgi:hypothetical protein